MWSRTCECKRNLVGVSDVVVAKSPQVTFSAACDMLPGTPQEGSPL